MSDVALRRIDAFSWTYRIFFLPDGSIPG